MNFIDFVEGCDTYPTAYDAWTAAHADLAEAHQRIKDWEKWCK